MLAINAEKRKEDNNKDKRILVVDNEKDILLLLQLILEQNGFNVSLFDSPLAALSNFKIGLYDLAILDIRMPQMNGFELHEKIKQIDKSAKICFITATGEERYYYDQFIEKKKREGEEREENERRIGVGEQHQYQHQQHQQEQYFHEFNKATFLKKPISNVDLVREVNRII